MKIIVLSLILSFTALPAFAYISCTVDGSPLKFKNGYATVKHGNFSLRIFEGQNKLINIQYADKSQRGWPVHMMSIDGTFQTFEQDIQGNYIEIVCHN